MTTRNGHRRESGSIFIGLFAAVAMLGVATAGLNLMMRGPLTTMSNVNRQTVAENNMVAAARLAVVMAPTAQTNAGDCDNDGYVEPIPYRDAGAGAKPTGGGYLPQNLGAKTSDPWNTEFGYCAWDMGSLTVTDNVAACGGSSAKRLKGAPNNAQYAVAIVSAGPDKTFQTTCSAYADANADGRPDTPLIASAGGSDDMVMGYTYAEATKVGGGGNLWAVKSGAPGTATIAKDVEVSGSAKISGALALGGGLVLPGDPGNNSVTGACNAANDQKLRRNTSTNPPMLEICNFAGGGNAWEKVKILDNGKHVPFEGSPCTTIGETKIGRQCFYEDSNTGDYISVNCEETPPVDPNSGFPYDIYDYGWGSVVCTATGWASPFYYYANGEIRNSFNRRPQNITTYGVTDKEYIDKVIKDTGLPTCALNEWAIKTEAGYGCFCGNPNGAVGWIARTTADQRVWTDVASSADGSRLIASFTNSNSTGNVMISSDYGRSWAEHAPAAGGRYWNRIASSANGLKLAAAANNGYIYTSVDGGVTWTERTSSGQRYWSALEYSPDGTRIIAAGGSGNAANSIYTSTDEGATWTQRTGAPARNWTSIAMSTDGLKIAAAPSNGTLYTSTDGGVTWAIRDQSRAWFGVASSSDGVKLAAVVGGGGSPVYSSTDSGVTWTQRTGAGNRNWIDIASSADGTKLAATTYNSGYVYTSTDSGVTWTQQTSAGTGNWYRIASSSDGTKIISYKQTENIYTYGAGCALGSCTGPGGTSVPNGSGMAAFLTSGVPYGEACIGETRLCSNGALGGSMENASCAGGFAKIGIGNAHTCALTAAGKVWCWGRNDSGQLGDTTTVQKNIPTALSGAHVFTVLGRGSQQNCALKADGSAWCWGNNAAGQLGDGTTTNRTVPTPVNTAIRFKSVSTRASNTCALNLAGAAWCWGSNGNGQLGDGTTTQSLTPVAVINGHTFTTLSTGQLHSCAVKANGSALCWGSNSNGQLGDGTVTQRTSPTPVTGGHVFTTIDSGWLHTCALKNDNTAWCWGSNTNGQIGDNSTLEKLNPTAVSGGHVFTILSAGLYHNCALKSDGTAWCWGLNSNGQLGDNTTTDKLVPTAVTGGHKFVDIAAGNGHTCALKSDGATLCWGLNTNAQIGDNTTAQKNVPTPIYQP